jgi:hypothetical protein
VAEFHARQLGVVLEGCWAVSRRRWLRHPQLDAMDLVAAAAGALLGVGDAAAGGHEVGLAWRDDLLGAEAVAVQCLAFVERGGPAGR